jgi:hypothetical protein
VEITMHRASIITDQTAARCQSRNAVSFVDRDLAASLLCDFLTAVECEGPEREIWIEYACSRAEVQLREWGVTRLPIFGLGA